MSNIVTDTYCYKDLKKYFESLRENEIDAKTIRYTGAYLSELNYIRPRFNVGSTGSFASFNVEDESVNINVDKLNRVIDYQAHRFAGLDADYLTVRNMLFLLILGHEIEHYDQYLISKGELNTSSKNLKLAYKILFDLAEKAKKGHLSPKKIQVVKSYNENASKYLLERNAQIETYDMLHHIIEEKYPELASRIREYQNEYRELGYQSSLDGSIHETLSSLGLQRKYEFFSHNEFDLPVEQRVRYGLPISNLEQEKVKIK